jgi:hypothetical protein
MNVEEDYFDVLQNIEASIVAVHKEHRSLTDADALACIEALIRRYTAETRGKAKPVITLNGLANDVNKQVEYICEFRLGRVTLENQPMIKPITPDVMVLCLKRIRKSIEFWTKANGRQGYLNYIKQFVK